MAQLLRGIPSHRRGSRGRDRGNRRVRRPERRRAPAPARPSQAELAGPLKPGPPRCHAGPQKGLAQTSLGGRGFSTASFPGAAAVGHTGEELGVERGARADRNLSAPARPPLSTSNPREPRGRWLLLPSRPPDAPRGFASGHLQPSATRRREVMHGPPHGGRAGRVQRKCWAAWGPPRPAPAERSRRRDSGAGASLAGGG